MDHIIDPDMIGLNKLLPHIQRYKQSILVTDIIGCKYHINFSLARLKDLIEIIGKKASHRVHDEVDQIRLQQHIFKSLFKAPHIPGSLKEVGIGFLFAPLFHGAMKYAAGPRQEIGLRTIFNVLGPLTNPAGATAQVLGVYDSALTEKIAQVLGRLGTGQAFVVCGEGTFDEISITSPTRVSHLKDGKVRTYDITPEEFGMKRAHLDSIKGGDPQENADIVRRILEGEKGPKRDMVILNTGAAFAAAGLDPDIETGIKRAVDSIDAGKAKEKLNELILFTQRCATAE
jgi:anthranilate phosphoribosyltransferase